MRRTASAGDEKACGQNDVCQKNMADHQEGDVCFGRQSAFFEQGRPTRNKCQDGRNQRRKQQQMNRRRHRQEKPVVKVRCDRKNEQRRENGNPETGGTGDHLMFPPAEQGHKAAGDGRRYGESQCRRAGQKAGKTAESDGKRQQQRKMPAADVSVADQKDQKTDY